MLCKGHAACQRASQLSCRPKTLHELKAAMQMFALGGCSCLAYCLHLTGSEVIPEVNQQLCLSEVLHFIPGDVVDWRTLVPAQLQASEDVIQQVHVVKPACQQPNDAVMTRLRAA